MLKNENMSEIDTRGVEIISNEGSDTSIVAKNNEEVLGDPCFNEISVNNSIGVHFGSKIYEVHINEFNDDFTSNIDIKNVTNDDTISNKEINNRNDSKKGKFNLSFGQLWIHYKACVLLVAFIVILLILLIPLLLSMIAQDSNPPTIIIKDLEVWDEGLKKRIVQRREWEAKPPLPQDMLTVPVPMVVIHHSAGGSCNTRKLCTQKVQSFQNRHMVINGWDDIAYNFIIGGEGSVYVGHGWDTIGAHSGWNYNQKSIGICFIGNFKIEYPTKTQIEGTKLLLEEGVHQNKLTNNYKLLARTNLSGANSSPGINLYNEIKTWLHFSQYPD